MTTHRLYIENDNLQPAIDLLKELPDGEISILIGKVDNLNAMVSAIIEGLGPLQRLAVLQRMEGGSVTVKVTGDKLPIDKNIVVIVE